MIDEQFKRYFMGEFPKQSELAHQAFLLWCEYYFITEEYDRSVCSQMRNYGFEAIAIPTTPEEFTKINNHAKEKNVDLVWKAIEKGIPDDILLRGKAEAGRLKHEQLKELLNRKDVQ